MKFKTTLETFDWSIWHYHFPIPQDITKSMSSKDHRRVICVVNNTITIHAALMPIDDGSYIMVNKDTRKKLGLEEGDEVELELKRDTSTYGVPVPESFHFVMDTDHEASAYFEALTPGKQRSLIYIVKKVKNMDKQISKSLAIAEHLKRQKGALDFKILNEVIKEYNQKSL